MAQSTQRTVELNIKLSGVQSVEELEQVTSEINAELKQIPINSKAFNEMSALAQKANSKVKEIDKNLEGITGAEKAESLFKLGEGLAGAFAAAQGASLLFGEKTSEQLEKVIQQVGGLVIALDGVKKVSEAFAAENITKLKGVVAGFRASSIAAKLFGTTTRAALTATGIGILVVLLGTIIANWNKIKKVTVDAFNALKNYVPIFYVIGKAVDTIKEKFGNLKAFIAGVGAAIKAAFTFGADISDAFDAAVAASLELQKVDAEILKLTTETKQAMEDELEVMSAQGNKQIEIYNLQLKYNKEVQDALELKKKTTELSEEEEQLLHDVIQAQKVLNAQKKKYNDDQSKAAKERQESINKENDELKKRLDEEAEERRIAFLEKQKQLRGEISDLESQTGLLLNEHEYSFNNILLQSKTLNELATEYINNNTKYVREIQLDWLDNLEKGEYIKLSELEYTKQLNTLDLKRNSESVKFLDEENKKIRERINAIQSGQVYYEDELEGEKELLELTNKKIANENEIFILIQEGNNLNAENSKILKEQEEILSNGILLGYEKLQGWLEENNEEVEKSVELLNQSFELFATLAERKAELAQQELDQYIKDNEARYQSDIETQKKITEDKTALLNDYNELIKDAEGERLEDLLEGIKQEEAAIAASKAEAIRLEEEYKNEILKRQYEVEIAEYKAAKRRKIQSIIDATIQGALAVIKALPNFVLAAVTGALAAVTIATIVAQPLPPEPEKPFADGGIVSGNSYSGDQIKGRLNSGEMVLNEKQQANLFKMANTGNISGTSSGMIDYDLLSLKLAKAIQANPSFVSVTEFNNVSNRLKVVESRASLSH